MIFVFLNAVVELDYKACHENIMGLVLNACMHGVHKCMVLPVQ